MRVYLCSAETSRSLYLGCYVYISDVMSTTTLPPPVIGEWKNIHLQESTHPHTHKHTYTQLHTHTVKRTRELSGRSPAGCAAGGVRVCNGHAMCIPLRRSDLSGRRRAALSVAGNWQQSSSPLAVRSAGNATVRENYVYTPCPVTIRPGQNRETTPSELLLGYKLS